MPVFVWVNGLLFVAVTVRKVKLLTCRNKEMVIVFFFYSLLPENTCPYLIGIKILQFGVCTCERIAVFNLFSSVCLKGKNCCLSVKE